VDFIPAELAIGGAVVLALVLVGLVVWSRNKDGDR
jgi:hypothetical protein